MKNFLIIIVMIFMSAHIACSSANNSVRNITAELAYQMIQGLEEFIIIDTRTYNEFRNQRIEGAVNIPYDQIADRAVQEIADKQMVILVYCQAGRRSAIAANFLVKLGFVNVYNFGGINNWRFSTVSG